MPIKDISTYLPSDIIAWQAKTSQVYLDLENTIDYENLTLEMLGNSVLYLPYLSVPSPKVEKNWVFDSKIFYFE